MKDGILDGLSIGVDFPEGSKVELVDGMYVVSAGARLNEISLVTVPAFADARVLSVAASRGPVPQGVPMSRIKVTEEPVYQFRGSAHGPSFVADLTEIKRGGDGKKRDQADARVQKFQRQLESGDYGFAAATTSNAGELFTPDIGYVKPVVGPITPLYDMLGSPRQITGTTPQRIITIAPAANLVAAVTEGTNPDPVSITAKNGASDPIPYAGIADLTREALDGADGLDAAVFAVLLGSYAIRREAAIAALLTAQTGLGATGALTGDGVALSDALSDQITDAIYRPFGNVWNMAAGQTAYKALAKARSSSDYLLPRVPERGTGALLAGPGAVLRPAPALGANLVFGFDPNALDAFESPGLQLRLDETPNAPAQVRLALYGYFGVTALTPGGIYKLTYTAA